MKDTSFKYPIEPLTFANQISEIILGVSYFANLSYFDKLKSIDLLYPLAIDFFKSKNLEANFLNAFVLREDLILFINENLVQYSNYSDGVDTRTKTGKKIDNTVMNIQTVIWQYLRFRDNKIHPKSKNKKNKYSNRDERLILGMPQSVAPIAVSLFVLIVFYLAWVYIIKK